MAKTHLVLEAAAEVLATLPALMGCCVLSARGTWDKDTQGGLAHAVFLAPVPFEVLPDRGLPDGRPGCDASGLQGPTISPCLCFRGIAACAVRVLGGE